MTRKKAALHLSVLLPLMLTLSQLTQAESVSAKTPSRVDIFTTTNQPITAINALAEQFPDTEIQIHKLDGIKQFEATLSEGLPGDPDKAMQQALQRLQQMSQAARSQLEHSATALARAVQYGVEQFPAIVFDGELVVYGLSDCSVALMHYRHWQQGQMP